MTKLEIAEQAEQRPQNCGTGYCSCIECPYEAEQAEHKPVGRWNWNEAKFEWLTKFDYHKHHMTPLYAAPQPVMQEPVAWAHPSGGYLSARYMKEFATGLEKETYTIPLYAAPVQQVEQEPVGVVEGSGEWGIAGVLVAGVPIGTKLYAAPVRTKDLTDDEIAQAVGSPLDEVYLADFRAVIAADREKNK